MNISSGAIPHALKLLCYGVEGIGKSTFVSKMPDPVFIDTENGTRDLNVKRFDPPTSWQMLLQEVQYVKDHPEVCKSLVIDSLDWAERLCVEHILAKHQKTGLEDFGYGAGYRYVYEEFGRLLNLLSDVANKGIHIGMTAHCAIRKMERPDESGSYDRWALKLIDSPKCSIAAMVREFVDLLLFANYKVFVYATDDKGKKHKASGGQRMMYTTHSIYFDAKNRQGLPDEMPFDFNQVAALFAPIGSSQAPVIQAQEELPIPASAAPPQPAQDAPAAIVQDNPPPERNAPQRAPEPQQTQAQEDAFQGVPPALADLMRADGIHPDEVRAAIAQRGYFPLDTPWAKYPADFVQGVLIGAWPQVKQMCMDNRKNTPF